MSGKSNGHGGRGGGKASKKKPPPDHGKDKKESEEKGKKFSLPTRKHDNHHSFESVKKQIERDIQEFDNDAAELLAEMFAEEVEHVFTPIPVLNVTPDQQKDELLMDALKEERSEAVKTRVDMIKQYNRGKSNICGLILNKYTTIGMSQKLERLPDWKLIKKRPLELLSAIRDIMHSTGEQNSPNEVA